MLVAFSSCLFVICCDSLELLIFQLFFLSPLASFTELKMSRKFQNPRKGLKNSNFSICMRSCLWRSPPWSSCSSRSPMWRRRKRCERSSDDMESVEGSRYIIFQPSRLQILVRSSNLDVSQARLNLKKLQNRLKCYISPYLITFHFQVILKIEVSSLEKNIKFNYS